MVRKLSKVRLKVAGSTGKSWVRIFAPRFVTLMTVQARTPGWPLKKSRAPFSMCVLPIDRWSLSGPGITPDHVAKPL